MSMMIILGLVLIVVGILFALPVLGVGLVIPVMGDIIDIPISFVLVLLGSIVLIVGGLGHFFSEFWWIFVLGFAIWYLLFVVKIGVNTKRRKK